MILKPKLLPFGAIEGDPPRGVAHGCECRSRVRQPIRETTRVQPVYEDWTNRLGPVRVGPERPHP